MDVRWCKWSISDSVWKLKSPGTGNAEREQSGTHFTDEYKQAPIYTCVSLQGDVVNYVQSANGSAHLCGLTS